MISFRGVSMTYPNGTCALKDVNLTVGTGEFAFILGPSGAGKSTFLKLILAELTPTKGTVEVNGFKMPGLPRKKVPMLRRSMGIVFQDFRLIPTMNVYDNVAFAMRVTGALTRDVRKRVPEVLAQVGLARKAKNFPHEISGGELQRVALARALANRPSLLIADEPTGNIDPELSFEILELLCDINRRGTTILVVTHEHELVSKFDKRIIVIDGGSIAGDSADWGAQ